MIVRPEYHASRVQSTQADIFAKAPCAEISCCPWDSHPVAPKSCAQVVYTKDTIFVRLTSWETDPLITYHQPNEPVYEDSCLECFIAPVPGVAAFCDFECNAAGTLLVGRYDRGDFRLLDPQERVGVTATAHRFDDRWQVDIEIPMSFFAKVFPDYKQGDTPLGVNFYKCGDKTSQPHYACWSRIQSPEISFFHPEDFGLLILD